MAKDTYEKYVADTGMLNKYNAYQSKYQDEPRESDKVLIGLVQEESARGATSLLDIGCSTGNLLRHLRRLLPQLRLVGGDLSGPAIEKCRVDPKLDGIEFALIDMLNISDVPKFDVVVANAVAVYFDWATYRKSAESVFTALRPGGAFLAFEWLHPFAVQDLTIIETSSWHPDGLKICFRPMRKVEAMLRDIGFSAIEFRPFELPIDLPVAGYDQDVITYTRKDEHGHRMAFRGALYQPWCHLIARKA